MKLMLLLGLLLASAGPALADATASPSSPSPAVSASPSGSHWGVDPCTLLSASDVSQTLGAVNPHPQRPTADECLWSAASNSHAPGAVSQVLFTVDAAQQARHCKGIGCLAVVQSVSGYIPGLDRFNTTVSELGSAATVISGIGQRAAWGQGILAVLQDDVIFKLKLSGTQSDMLDASEGLAQKVVSNMKTTPH